MYIFLSSYFKVLIVVEGTREKQERGKECERESIVSPLLAVVTVVMEQKYSSSEALYLYTTDLYLRQLTRAAFPNNVEDHAHKIISTNVINIILLWSNACYPKFPEETALYKVEFKCAMLSGLKMMN